METATAPGAVFAPLPPGPYQIIYADPPWSYADGRSAASAGMARSAYACLSMDQLQGLPVASIASDRSVLALWATMPKLPEAIRLMSAWGFAYCTALFVWVKANPTWEGPYLLTAPVTGFKRHDYAGLGHYTRANAEVVLLGRRGKALSRLDRTVRQIVFSARGAHSAKPAEVRDRLVRLFGDLARIELFARERVGGWDAWGLEVGGA